MKKIAVPFGIATLVVSGTALAATGSFASGTYRGKTSQGDQFVMTVNQTKLVSATYKAIYKCQDQKTLDYHMRSFATKLPAAPIKNQQVYKIYHLPHRNDVTLKATLSGSTSSGWFTQAFAARDKHTGHQLACGTYGEVHFALHLH